jgi:serine/threonine protein kinase
MEPPLTPPVTVSHYELQSVLGSGAFSTVYRAVDTTTHHPWAVKVIPKSTLPSDDARARLQREITAMTYLVHPNVVHLDDFISDDQYFYLVMELITGGDLAEFIHNSLAQCRERVAAGLFFQIVSGIQYCHSRGVAHRDLKPQNILLTKDHDVRIADFGLCHFNSPDSAMKTICGTAVYLAPECLTSEKYDGFARDIWSLGVILYELVTRDYPWTIGNGPLMYKQILSGKFPIPTGVSSICVDLIVRILKLRPKDRPTASQILESNWFKLAPAKSGIRISVSGPSLCDLASALEGEEKNDLGVISPLCTPPRTLTHSTSKGDFPRVTVPVITSPRLKGLEKTSSTPFETASRRFRGRVLK